MTDDSAGWMCQAQQLHTLQIFHTGMTEEGHATLLTKLPNLKVTVWISTVYRCIFPISR